MTHVVTIYLLALFMESVLSEGDGSLHSQGFKQTSPHRAHTSAEVNGKTRLLECLSMF